MSLLECLVVVSEKAANIARKCRQEQQLFELLVEEKKSNEANPRFVQDFKTLADVLIQQTVKHDVGKYFPEIKDYIKGEESNIFCNKLGETICVDIQDTPEETSNLLEKVLDGNKEAADLLSAEVHKNLKLSDVNTNRSLPQNINIDTSNVGIWIDPIDSTAEYISGKETEGPNGIYLTGLQCVTVLIGAYDKYTGESFIGVINQPFFEQNEKRWDGYCYWGVCLENMVISSYTANTNESHIISLSSTESKDIKEKLKSKNYQLAEAAGAGYKLLSVITGLADAYILTKDSTFKWDTCGPQAILRSLGGNAFVYANSSSEDFVPIDYLDKEGDSKIKTCCNTGGILACKNIDLAKELLDILKTL